MQAIAFLSLTQIAGDRLRPYFPRPTFCQNNPNIAQKLPRKALSQLIASNRVAIVKIQSYQGKIKLCSKIETIH
ncbi:hypothetical protein NSP_4860 [Nodularia spumigena CCY9414]|nr:hypothetical protein NSP_4860 [Nodularia spumigena CCY9414]